jgi:hypothetical protein
LHSGRCWAGAASGDLNTACAGGIHSIKTIKKILSQVFSSPIISSYGFHHFCPFKINFLTKGKHFSYKSHSGTPKKLEG